ncbi:hypothetical protein K1719_041862 [Acacia pycnantha]|nr:hypothetical protein K1719_041862 [Acacia pycnantha]
MMNSGIKPNSYTFPFLLKSCAKIKAIYEWKQVHAHILKLGFASDADVHTSLITMYAWIGDLDNARLIFDSNICHRFEEALSCFCEMLKANVSPNQSTSVTSLSSCAQSRSLEFGKWISSWIKEHGLSSNLQLTNALTNMYSKCGEIDTAGELFDGIVGRDVILELISGLAMHGHPEKALTLFCKMANGELQPDDITFVGVLSACSQGGLVDLGC